MKSKKLFIITILVSNLFCITIVSNGLALPLFPMDFGYTLTIKDKAEEIWNVTIHCYTSVNLNDYVTFGEALDANDGSPVDMYDTPKPPTPMEPYIYAWLNDNLPSPYNRLFSDYRQYPDTSKIWNLTVQYIPSSESSPITITLSWDTTKVDDTEYSSVNLCNENGTILQNMLTNNNYVFSCPAYVPQNYKIICTNNPPVLGTPTPNNGSIGNPLDFTWSIPINDPEGDLFSWTIQCNNGQTNSGTNQTNGTKSLLLSGLASSSTYKVWVNATSPTGNNLYTRKWYTFSTIVSDNQPPSQPTIFGPTTGTKGVTYNYNFMTVDPDGDDVYYRIHWGDGSPFTQWIGPLPSGQMLTLPYIYSISGSYIVQCQAKDTNNHLSDWGSLGVIMPYSFNPFLQQFIEKLFQWFPNAFPILRHMMGY